MKKLDGFYAGYLSSATGNGMALLVLLDGRLVGADAGGFKFDGKASQNEGSLDVDLSVYAPPGVDSILGFNGGPLGISFRLNFEISIPFNEDSFTRIDTQFGPVNLRMVKIRDL